MEGLVGLGSSAKRKRNGLSASAGGSLLLPEKAEDVDTKNGKRQVWLLKVPRMVADAWEGKKTGEELGNIKIVPARDPGGKAKLTLSVSSSSGGGGAGDVKYVLEAPPSTVMVEGAGRPSSVPNYFVMSAPTAKCKGDKKVRVEGKVQYRLDARPIVNERHAKYRELKRERTERADVRLNSTQMLDEKSRALASRHLAARTTRTNVMDKLDKQFMKRTVGEGEGERAQARDDLYDTIYKYVVAFSLPSSSVYLSMYVLWNPESGPLRVHGVD